MYCNFYDAEPAWPCTKNKMFDQTIVKQLKLQVPNCYPFTNVKAYTYMLTFVLKYINLKNTVGPCKESTLL